MWFRKKKADPVIEEKSASFLIGGGWGGWMAHSYNTLAVEGYSANSIVYSCINHIANRASSVELCVQEQDGQGKITKPKNSPLYDLIEKPNAAQSLNEVVRDMIVYYLIGGNSYLLGTGLEKGAAKPTELIPLNPSHMSVDVGEHLLWPKGFKYSTKATNVYYPVDEVRGKTPVLHLKTLNPLNRHVGLAPMVAASFGVDIFNAGQKWNKSLLDNSACPPGAIVMKNKDGSVSKLSDEQYKRLKNQIDEKMTGAKNAGKPLLLEGGLEWQQIGMKARDMDFEKNMLNAARFIAGVYGVPPQLVNIPGESTYSNYGQAKTSLWLDTVLPTLDYVLERMNRWLTPMYGGKAYIGYEREKIPALDEIQLQRAAEIDKLQSLSINEKREMMSKESIDGGDTVLVNANSVPLEMAGFDLPENDLDAKPEPSA